jgi:hypothetical protein
METTMSVGATCESIWSVQELRVPTTPAEFIADSRKRLHGITTDRVGDLRAVALVLLDLNEALLARVEQLEALAKGDKTCPPKK